MSPDELVKKKFDGGLHLATHIHYRKTLREPAASKAACPDPVPNNFNDTTATSAQAKLTYSNGICRYNAEQNLFPLGIEGMNFNIIPGYDTTSKNYAGVKPKTFVRRKGSDADVYTFAAGQNIALDVQQLMDLAGLDLDTDAGAAIDAIDTAIATVSTQRGNLGAVQNRLESTISNLQVTSENLAASESRIRDTDVAAEMVAFTRAQILQQAGTAMLGQANANSSSALRLLG